MCLKPVFDLISTNGLRHIAILTFLFHAILENRIPS